MENSISARQTALLFSRFLFLFFLSPFLAYAQTSQLSGPPGDGGTEGSTCSNPIDFYYGQQQQINFSEDQQTAWIRFETDSEGLAYVDFTKLDAPASAKVSSLRLYEGSNCEMELVEEKNAPYALMSYMNESLGANTPYLLEISRREVYEEGLPEQGLWVELQRPILSPCITSAFSPCSRIKNGDLQNIPHFPNHGDHFNSNCAFDIQVCDWTGIGHFYSQTLPQLTDKVVFGHLITNYIDPDGYSVPGVAIAQVDIEANKNYYFSIDLRESNGVIFGTKALPDKITVKLVNSNDPAYGCDFYDLSTMPSKVIFQTSNLSSLVGTSNNSYYEDYVQFPMVFNSGSGDYDRLVIYAEDLLPYEGFPILPNIFFDNLILSDLPSAGEDKLLVCENSAQLGNGGCPGKSVNFSWSPSSNLNNPNAANPIVTPTSTGTTTYTMTATFTEDGKTFTYTDQVDVSKTNQTAYTDVSVQDGWDIDDAFFANSQSIIFNSGEYTSSGHNFYIEGDFIVNADFTMTDCNILLAPGAKIIVNNGATFSFNGDAVNKDNFIKGCGGMWDGIEVTDAASEIYINNAYPFSDATNGITVSAENIISISDNHFDRNNRVLNVSGNDPIKDLFEFKNNLVECTDLLKSNGNYYWPDHSLVFKNGEIVSSAIDNDVFNNTFNATGGNIYIENFSPVSISDNVFRGFNNLLFGFPNQITKPTRAIRIQTDNLSYVDLVKITRNRFLNCKIAIESEGIASLIAEDNFININVDGTSSNVLGDKCSFLIVENNTYPSTLDITGNKGTNLSEGVIITNNFGSHLLVNDNDFNLNLNTNSIGIKISNNGQSISNSPLLTGNIIRNANVGILIQGMDVVGFEIVGNTILNLVHNTCGVQSPPNCKAGSYGIKVENGFYYLSDNTVKYQNPLDYANAVGIQVSNSAYEITCNYIENSGSAVLFQGTNTHFFMHGREYQMDNNVFHDSYLGLVISNSGSFDYIGTSSDYVENTWSYSYYLPPVPGNPTGNYAYSETYAANNSNGHQSDLYNSPKPTVNKKDISSTYPIAPKTPVLSGYSPSCSAPNPSPLVNGTGQNTLIASGTGGVSLDTSGSTATNSFWKSPLFRNKAKFVAHADSFAHFELQRFYITYKHDSAMHADAALSAVYDSLEHTPLGKSIDGKNAFSLANAHPFDLEYKTINSIYSAYMQNDSLSSIDSNTARNLAASCPYYKGMAVYKARNLMALLGEYHFINECEMVKVQSGTSFQRLKSGYDEQSGFKLYPNPSTGLFRIQLPSGMEKADIKVYNVQGILVKEQKLENQNTLDLSQMNNGIYLYKLIPSKGGIQTGKLQILK